jgi:glutathione S-transferase
MSTSGPGGPWYDEHDLALTADQGDQRRRVGAQFGRSVPRRALDRQGAERGAGLGQLRAQPADRSRSTVADAYLVTMLNWFALLGVALTKWPTLAACHQKHLKRPSLGQAMDAEMEERTRRLAA